MALHWIGYRADGSHGDRRSEEQQVRQNEPVIRLPEPRLKWPLLLSGPDEEGNGEHDRDQGGRKKYKFQRPL